MIITMSSGSDKKGLDEYLKKLTLVAEGKYDSDILKQIVSMLAAKEEADRGPKRAGRRNR